MDVEYEITVARGRAQEFEVLLREGAFVEGSVVDEQGKPVAGAEVRAALAEDNEEEGYSLASDRQSKTDADGRFRIGGLCPGASFLIAQYPRGIGDLYTRKRVAFTAPARDLRLTVVPRTRIRVRLLQPDGTPYMGTVRCALDGKQRLRGSRHDVHDGSLLLTDVKSGHMGIMLAPEGHAWLQRTITVTDGALLDMDDITLGTGVSITGRVIDRDGQPIVGAHVYCRDNYRRGILSDTNGQFRLDRLPAGPVAFGFEAEGFFEHGAQLETTPGGVTVRLQRPTPTCGSLAMAGGVLPPASRLLLHPYGAKGVVVTGRDWGTGEPWTRTDCEGTEVFGLTRAGQIIEQSIAPGRYVAWLHTPGLDDRRLGEVTIVEGETNELRFALPK